MEALQCPVDLLRSRTESGLPIGPAAVSDLDQHLRSEPMKRAGMFESPLCVSVIASR